MQTWQSDPLTPPLPTLRSRRYIGKFLARHKYKRNTAILLVGEKRYLF